MGGKIKVASGGVYKYSGKGGVASYFVTMRVNGIKHYKGGFKELDDAKCYADSMRADLDEEGEPKDFSGSGRHVKFAFSKECRQDNKMIMDFLREMVAN
jgi:hypothetical protein